MRAHMIMRRRTAATVGVTALVAGLLAGPMTGVALASPLVFTVNNATNASDSTVGDGVCAISGGGCTLRAAIQEANANAGSDTINFNLASPYKIVLNSFGLPAITSPVTIDGTSLPGFSAPTTIVRVDGNAVTSGIADDLDVEPGGGGTIIKGLELVGAGTAEVRLAADGNTVAGNYIGATSGGAVACNGGGNCGGVDGVQVDSASNNLIGGLTAADRNVVANNNLGVHIYTSSGAASNNVIEGNYIGTNRAGSAAVPNQEGVFLEDQSGSIGGPANTVVGGSASGAGNLISGNNDTGVEQYDASGTTITGNTIGLNASGAKLGNAYGIYGTDVSGNPTSTITIGGPAAAARNVVSGNSAYGIDLTGPMGASLIQNNYVGVSASGALDRGNGYEGIYVTNADNATIDSNVVSGNDDAGSSSQLQVDYGDSDTVSNNIVGLAADGSTALPSPCIGLYLSGDSSLTLTGNTTGSDACTGFQLDSLTGATITDNKSGTDVSGTISRANAQDGFYLSNSTEVSFGTANHGNQSSANSGYGLNINNLSDSTIRGNRIGTNPAGTATLVNGPYDIYLGNSNDVTIGGTGAGDGNVLAGTGGGCCGAAVYVGGGSNNTVLGNLIGVGTGGQNLGNGYDGVSLDGSSQHITVGGTAAGAGNTIANSGNDGICNGGQRNHFVGNTITSNGALGIDNGCDGVTPNDNLDKDTGANQLQNFPVLSNSLSNANGTQVSGTLNSRPNTTYTLDFYASGACDPSGNGEGATYLGQKQVTTDGLGNNAFKAQVPASAADNAKITATATGPFGDTSEFSACLVNHSGLPTISVANNSASEGAGNLSFTVSLSSAPVNVPVTVDYATSDGTATAPGDYTASSGTVTFNSGETTKQVSVPIINDTLDENDETFTLTLSNPDNALIGAGQGTATGTIQDNDAPPTVSVSSLARVTEGNSGTVTQNFRVKLSTASALPVSVVAATVGGGATADVDFQSAAANITFAPGETTKTFSVLVNGDTIHENTEFYFVNLYNPVNATIGTTHAGGEIDDDDALPQLTIGDVSIPEGNSGTSSVSVPISLNTPSGLAVKVFLMTVNGTATAPSDYATRGTAGAPATLTIPAGSTTTSLPVTIKGDTVVEPDETFTVQMPQSPINATVARGTGTVTITNDD